MVKVLLVMGLLLTGIPLYLIIGRWMCRWPAAFMCAIGVAFKDWDWKGFSELFKTIQKNFTDATFIIIWPALMLAMILACAVIIVSMSIYYLGRLWWDWAVEICSA